MAQIFLADPVFEDSGNSLLNRVYGTDGALIVQASISSIAVSAFYKDTREAIATASPSVSAVVYDTLQTGAILWPVDSTGFNFRYDAPATFYPEGGRDVMVEIKFTPASGQVFHIVWEVPVLNLYRS